MTKSEVKKFFDEHGEDYKFMKKVGSALISLDNKSIEVIYNKAKFFINYRQIARLYYTKKADGIHLIIDKNSGSGCSDWLLDIVVDD